MIWAVLVIVHCIGDVCSITHTTSTLVSKDKDAELRTMCSASSSCNETRAGVYVVTVGTMSATSIGGPSGKDRT